MFTDEQLKQLRQVMQEVIRPLSERLGGVEQRLDRIEAEQKKQSKDIRGLKLKAGKTWNLLRWFTQDADKRIVVLEKAIKQN